MDSKTKMDFKTRELYPDELRVLKTLKTQTEKKSGCKIKIYHFVLAVFLGIVFAYLATLTKGSFWILPFGTIAVFSFGLVVFGPYELYKTQKRHKTFLQRLNVLIEKQTVDTCLINATRIALAEEYEDENDLYIVEMCKDKVLYLWDTEYNLNKNFPCLRFEIYERIFFELTGRQIYPLSEKIKPIMIDPKKKWKYMTQISTSEPTENISFDELMDKINEK